MKQTTLFDLPPTQVPSTIDAFFSYWNSKENLRKIKNPKTLVYKEAAEKIKRLRSGTLFTKYSLVDQKYWGMQFLFTHFKIAVDKFSERAYYAPYLSTVNLSDFLYNSFAVKNRSWFLSCLEAKQPASKAIKCVDMDLCFAIAKEYGKATNQSQNYNDYQPYETNLFRKATNLLVEKLRETEQLHDPLLLKTKQDKASLLVKTAFKCAKGDTNKVTIGYISAPWVISQIPLFMRNQGYLKSPAFFSIYTRR